MVEGLEYSLKTIGEYIAPRTPLPWQPSMSGHGDPMVCGRGQIVAAFEWSDDRTAAVQAVNEAPALRARVPELEAQLAAARVAVDALPQYPHHDSCKSRATYLLRNPPIKAGCDCGADEANAARTEARRALGLEV